MFLAATVYAVLRAKRGRGAESRGEQLAWWLGAGVFAGCAMLSKYQAALPLFVLLITVCIANRESPRQLITGVTLATAGFAIVFSPHVYWAVINDFPALRYASGAIESGGFVKRLAWIGSFFANQIRMVFPLLVAFGISFALCRIRRAPSHKNLSDEIPPNEASQVNPTSGWMWCLVWAPLAILIVASLFSGSKLRNNWGVQLFKFLPIWLAARWQGNRVLKLSNLMPAMLVAHAIGFGYYAIKQSDPMAAQAERRADSSYPAQSMAQAAQAHWKAQTNCPLKIVQGDFEAGLVSAFTAEFPVVYSNPVATPWVAPAQLALRGVLYVLDMNTPLPTEATAARKWFFSRAAFPSASASAAETGRFVQFAVRLPMAACSP